MVEIRWGEGATVLHGVKGIRPHEIRGALVWPFPLVKPSVPKELEETYRMDMGQESHVSFELCRLGDGAGDPHRVALPSCGSSAARSAGREPSFIQSWTRAATYPMMGICS